MTTTQDAETVRTILADVLTEAGIDLWLNSRVCPDDSRTARQLIALGDGEAVIHQAKGEAINRAGEDITSAAW